MRSQIIVDANKEQIRVTLLEDRELVELYIEDSEHQSLVGNVYRGRIENVLPGMQAAFVDIGLDKNAFLYINDIVNNEEQKSISELVIEGQEVDVQVIKEPIGTKGPRVTTNISLPGRYLVLLPILSYVGISKKIENEIEKIRLREIAEKIKIDNMGLIVRTEAEGKKEEDLARDLEFLLKLWDKINNYKKSIAVPDIIHKDFNLILRTVRDIFTGAVDKFIINNKEYYSRVMEVLELLSPSLKPRIEYFNKDDDIFEYYKIEDKIAKALDNKVWLKSGGYIVIDQTEALTAIDVNTGKYIGENNFQDTIATINMEAAKEIAKQLRLRDIGGIIIIDFIDMINHEQQAGVLDVLKEHLKKDRTKSVVMGITQLGLVEMTRKKVREQLSAVLKERCPSCKGTGKINKSYYNSKIV